MKILKQLNKNFCSSLLILIVLLLSVSSVSATENVGYYAGTYPNINKYLSDVFNDNIHDVHIFNNSGINVTKQFILDNQNKAWGSIMENYANGSYLLKVSKTDETGILEPTPHVSQSVSKKRIGFILNFIRKPYSLFPKEEIISPLNLPILYTESFV